MSKPLVIQLREAKVNITESVNSALREGLPCYLLEPIIAELHDAVSRAATAEYENALRQQAAEAAATAPEPEEEGGAEDGRTGA